MICLSGNIVLGTLHYKAERLLVWAMDFALSSDGTSPELPWYISRKIREITTKQGMV
jgi:hypothetical protein